MNGLLQTLEMMRLAQKPEDVFGLAASGVEGIKCEYRRLVKIVHADVNGQNQDCAHEATLLLNKWLEIALAQARYKAPGAIRLTSRKRSYTLVEPLCAGDLCDIYRASYEESGRVQPCIAKIVRQTRDNWALAREGSFLNTLIAAAGVSSFQRYFLAPVDAFAIRDGVTLKRVLILPEITDAFDLVSIRRRYPVGLDLRHMVWMWKRVLSAIGFAHQQGIVHGAVLPPHLLMRPADHGAYLIDWIQASAEGRAAFISGPYAGWYPPEVREWKSLQPATDIYLAAKCAIYLLGGEPLAETLPAAVPARLAAFIKSCLFKVPARRPQDAWALHAEFDETIVRPLFGAPKFVDFTMA